MRDLQERACELLLQQAVATGDREQIREAAHALAIYLVRRNQALAVEIRAEERRNQLWSHH